MSTSTDGAKAAEGSWQPLPGWNGTLLMSLFRERLLARLLEAHAISPQLVAKHVAWKHPGFSAHIGEPIVPEQEQRLEDTAAYPVPSPLSLKNSSTSSADTRTSGVRARLGSPYRMGGGQDRCRAASTSARRSSSSR